MNTTAVRPIAQTDYDAWKPLWDGYNAFYGREHKTALPHAVTMATWARFFDPAEPVHALWPSVMAACAGSCTTSITAAPPASS